MPLLTRAEATRYEFTSLHKDVMAFVAGLEALGDPRLRVTSFGTSPQGRELPLLVLSAHGVKTPEEAKALGRPVVLVISGIHAGEVEGKEGCLMLARDLLAGKPGLDADQILDRLTLVVVPLFNPDGNDAIDPGNRKLHLPKLAGQLGPESGVGTRVNGSKINLNRTHGLDAGWYGNFVEDERVLDADGEADPRSPVREGWMTYPHHPRFGSNYRGLTNRMDLLLVCYSYISFEERVRTAYGFMLETLRFVAGHADEVAQTVAASRTPRERIAVRYDLRPFEAPVEILTREPRTLEGAPTSIHLPYFGRFVGRTVVDRPSAYLVPASAIAALRGHGLKVEEAMGTVEAEVARVESLGTEGGRAILEAAKVGELAVSWRTEARAAAGMGLVRTDQPYGAIAVYLCEPESDDGAVENGLLPVPKVGDDYGIWRVRD